MKYELISITLENMTNEKMKNQQNLELLQKKKKTKKNKEWEKNESVLKQFENLQKSRTKMKKIAYLIGLTGTNGAGKGEVASFFMKKGYAYFSLSDVIREELKKKQ